MNIENLQTVQISNTLHDVGVPVHLLGYGYLKAAIALVLTDKLYLRAITKRLYPMIALSNNTTASRVERAIRHSIELTFGRAEYSKEYLKLFRSLADQPTNAEFIATLVEAIELKKLEEENQ